MIYNENGMAERNYILFIVGINTGRRISDIMKLKVGVVQDTYLKATYFVEKQSLTIVNIISNLNNEHLRINIIL